MYAFAVASFENNGDQGDRLFFSGITVIRLYFRADLI